MENVPHMSQLVRESAQIAAKLEALALNAVLESARAGAAGASFAVIAQELKKLAARAAGNADAWRQRMEGGQ